MGRISHKNDKEESKTKKQKLWEEEGLLEEIDLESGMEKDTLSRDEGEDDHEAGPQPLKPWALIFIFLGLAILSAIICAALWYFIHLERQDGQDQNQLPELTSGVSVGMTSNPTDVSDTDLDFRLSTEGSDVGMTSDLTGESADGSETGCPPKNM